MRDLRVSFPKPCGEDWEAMAPAGCGRICAACDKTVHDLSQYALAEAEALLRRDPDACVRARVGADGTIALKPGRAGQSRRMVMAVAATAALAAPAGPAVAAPDRPRGTIVGNLTPDGIAVRVIATGPAGRTLRTKVKSDGRYRIRRVPAGTYTLTFASDCGETWTVDGVVVADGETAVPTPEHKSECIVVGLLRIEDSKG